MRNDRNVPESIGFDFEEFCKDCDTYDAKVETAALYSANNKASVATNFTCEHIDFCRKIFSRFKDMNSRIF